MERRWRYGAIGFIIISWLIAIVSYTHLPPLLVSHWGASGNANAVIGRFWGDLLWPLIITVLWLVLLAIPELDPKKDNIAKFRLAYDQFVLIVLFFLFYVQSFVLWWNLGHHWPISLVLVPALAVILFACGKLMGQAQQNWFIGVRTPWTLSSDIVWRDTHKFAHWAYQVAAAITLFGIIWPSAAIWIFLAVTIIVSAAAVVYSRWRFTKLASGKDLVA